MRDKSQGIEPHATQSADAVPRPSKALRTARRNQLQVACYERMLHGRSMAQIGAELGIHPSTAWKACRRETARLAAADTESLSNRRRVLLHRLEIIWAGLVEKVKRGDSHAALVAVKVIERASRLLGTDAPTLVAMRAQIAHEHRGADMAGELAARFTVEELRVLERAAKMKLLDAADGALDAEVAIDRDPIQS